MKLFVATRKTQGSKSGDFCHVAEGEVVIFSVCEYAHRVKNSECSRSLSGVHSGKATTTFEVVEMPCFTVKSLGRRILESFNAGGWTGGLSQRSPKKLKAWHQIAQKFSRDLAQAAQKFPVGTICQRNKEGIIEAREPRASFFNMLEKQGRCCACGRFTKKAHPRKYPFCTRCVILDGMRCWCPCRCGCREPHVALSSIGLCLDCENGKHEVPPEGISRGIKELLRLHRSIARQLEAILRDQNRESEKPLLQKKFTKSEG